MAERPRLTVFMPAYNEEGGLERSVELLRGALAELEPSHEILVVDDGSHDGTPALADALAARHPDVRSVHHSVNRGIGGGMVTAIAEARGEWLILIPADLAIDLPEIGKYLAASVSADIVVGVRSDRSDYSGFRLLVSWVNIRLIQLLFGMRLRQFNYISMYRVDLLRNMRIDSWRSAFFFAEILIRAARAGCRLVEVEVTYRARSSGAATGANWGFIARTVREMLSFWWRIVRCDPALGITDARMCAQRDGESGYER